ncbi:MAG: hypothetical protein JRH12_07570 [Deltaproteobacteria bacterium]|jgi:hypothetical protein|nr:hypothetical protein [Deltaproteobacteria bacterium]MBW2482156.1 hypothetical protein [Deltaproteobacteria bacterium]
MSSNLINPRDIRKFGAIGSLFFGTLLAVAVWRDQTPVALFFGLLTLLSIGFLLMPVRMKPVYTGWLKIAHFMGSKVTLVMLGIIFYFVMTPAALLKRIFGGRPLPIKPDPDTETYWVTRSEPAQPAERFPKRF